MGQLRILGQEGDVKVEWNPDVEEEVKMAKKVFDENKKKGYRAFLLYDEGKRGEELKEFDKFAEKVVFITPMVGG